MHLLQQEPLAHAEDSCMQSSLYFTIKSIISTLEGAGYADLVSVQCRAMVAFYELGHGIYPAASISVGGCARLARALQLHVDDGKERVDNEARLENEEQQRTWWAIVNMDRSETKTADMALYQLTQSRYINLGTSDSLLATPDFNSSSPIPIDDDLWFQNV
jgi:hypothetical protein